MPGRQFVLEEIPSIGGAPPPGGHYQKFVWTAKNRSIPQGAWVFGITQRSVRTDYPGANDPTEQVLGPNFTPFTLSGRWDDRYNPLSALSADDPAVLGLDGRAARAAQGGFAVREWKRFEALVARGNIVRITFEDVTVQGIIQDAIFTYRRSSWIGYEFTMSPHHRQPGGQFALRRSPRSTLSASQLRSELVDILTEVQALHQLAPAPRMVGTLYLDVAAQVAAWAAQAAAIDQAIQQRQLSPEAEANTSLRRLAAMFFEMASIGEAVLALFTGTDSSEALDSESAMATMDYDVWSRGLTAAARRMIIAGQRAASELEQRARPNAQVLYRPQAGESLYSVSNRFYQTAHNWRAIADRNDLDTLVLTGDELLIIPEVTGR